jgi:hypothetical protein
MEPMPISAILEPVSEVSPNEKVLLKLQCVPRFDFDSARFDRMEHPVNEAVADGVAL